MPRDFHGWPGLRNAFDGMGHIEMRLRTRAEIDAEPRTAQFELHGPCEVIGVACQERAAKIPHPYILWVHPDNYTPSFCGTPKDCGGPYYRVLDESVRETDQFVSKDSRMGGTPVVVCEHMGRLIE